MNLQRFGVVHGRFQPFHVDHLTYTLAGLENCDFLFIGITNPDPDATSMHETDPKRSEKSANPLTYWERLLIIEACLAEAKVAPSRFCITPFPINKPYLLKNYVPLDAAFFMTIYDDWGRHKRDTLQALGLDVKVLWDRHESMKNMTGTQIRELMAADGDWENLVPAAAARIIKEYRMDIKIADG